MTGARFVTFLEKLLSETTRKVFLILDRLPAHETKAVADWVAEREDRIELFWLPKYAPELNADEYLNNDMKGAINAEGLPESREELRSRMARFMSKLLRVPAHVRNYFRHPCVQYASGG
jgi:transposase